MKSIVSLKWGHLFSLCNIFIPSVSVPGDRRYSGTLSGEDKMCFLPLVTLLCLKCFSCCGTLAEVRGGDVPVLMRSSQGPGSGLDSGQGHLFLKKLETSALLLCLFRRSKKQISTWQGKEVYLHMDKLLFLWICGGDRNEGRESRNGWSIKWKRGGGETVSKQVSKHQKLCSCRVRILSLILSHSSFFFFN